MNNELGSLGELLAATHLNSLGWEILFKNYRLKLGELDIIARDKEGVVAFVEVKTLESRAEKGLSPEDNLTRKKLRKLQQLAVLFANANPYLVSEQGWRIDLVAVVLSRDPLTNKYLSCVIKLYQNLF